ncbi:MAG: glycosyltransferase [Anaerolineae bacterium]|nr:glycosyltransferase [Anaerolineae bacterium]
MNILVLLRLIPVKARDYLWPLIQYPELTHLTIVRHEPLGIQHPKVSEVNFKAAEAQHSTQVRPLQRVLNIFRIFGLGFRTTRTTQPDVVYGIFMIPYGLFVFVIGKWFRKKTMLTLIGTDFNKDVLERPWRKFWQWMLKRIDIITIFDETARQKFINLGFDPHRIFVVPHAIDMQRYTRREGLPQDIDVIYTGHLWPLKEIWRTVTAWKTVLEHHPDARLALVGDGSARADLENLARDLGVSENVTFVGWSDDPVSWLSRARIFVNVSNQEGVPTAMLEAMACGLVPIVTAVGGVPSVIQDGVNGYLLENPADPALIARRILHLMNDQATFERLRDEALKIRDFYGYQAVSQAWGAVFQQLRK